MINKLKTWVVPQDGLGGHVHPTNYFWLALPQIKNVWIYSFNDVALGKMKIKLHRLTFGNLSHNPRQKPILRQWSFFFHLLRNHLHNKNICTVFLNTINPQISPHLRISSSSNKTPPQNSFSQKSPPLE